MDTTTEMRTYPDGTHVARRERRFSNDALGMRAREDFFKCSPTKAGPRRWIKIGDDVAVMAKLRWETDFDNVSSQVAIGDGGGLCPVCN